MTLAPLDPVNEVARILATVDLDRIRAVCDRHAGSTTGHGYGKYVDFEGQIRDKLRIAHGLGLRSSSPLRVLDLGTGAGYFPLICRAFGHEATATDLDDNPLYNDMTQALGILRRVHRIQRRERLPDLGGPFDLVTAFQVCFNGHKSTEIWGVDEWRFFLEDLAQRHLAPNGRIVLGLNAEADGSLYTPELRDYFAAIGARIDMELVTFSELRSLCRVVLQGPFAANGGLAWTAAVPPLLPDGDGPEALFRSNLVLCEDDAPLGPAHERHNRIREQGGGRFCHWGQTLYFSASDGTDPNRNGRRYSVEWRDAAAESLDAGAALVEIAAFVARPSDTAAGRVATAMAFVHRNSIHLIDEDHDRYAFDTSRMLRWMWAVEQTETASKPHLSCGPRTYALKAILDQLGMCSRPVQILSSRQSHVAAHRFLEVWDDETGRWTTWDPDHDVTYVSKGTREPVPAEAWIGATTADVEPRRGDAQGWDALGLAWLRDLGFAALLFESPVRSTALMHPLILYDPQRFEPDRRFEDGTLLTDWTRANFGECRFLPWPLGAR